MNRSITNRNRLWLSWAVIGLTIIVLMILLARLPLSGDFLGYWSGTALIGRGENAYDSAQLHTLQLATGRGHDFSVNVWNPPWTLVFLLPLGLLPFAWARALWLVISVLLVAVSGYWLGRAYWPHAGQRERLASAILPLLAVQVWVALLQGQINILVLFGIAGAMFWLSKRPGLAGSLLLLATVKPQIAIGALIILALRALIERQWRFILGATVAFSLLLLVLTLLRAQWIYDYERVLRTPLLDYRTPTLATWAREQWPTLPVNTLALLLSVLALSLLAAWTIRTRDWEAGVASAVVITMLFTLFNWSYDQIVLLVPAYFLLGKVRGKPSIYLSVIAALLLINLLVLGIRIAGSTNDFDFFWVAPVFAGVYVSALAWNQRQT
jgi:hypothetical protein